MRYKNVTPWHFKTLYRLFTLPKAEYGGDLVPWSIQKGVTGVLNRIESSMRLISRKVF